MWQISSSLSQLVVHPTPNAIDSLSWAGKFWSQWLSLQSVGNVPGRLAHYWVIHSLGIGGQWLVGQEHLWEERMKKGSGRCRGQVGGSGNG